MLPEYTVVDIVTTGHETVMAKATFFTSLAGSECDSEKKLLSQEFLYQECLLDTGSIASHHQTNPSIEHFTLLEFERPIVCPVQSKIIGSRLDSDTFSNKCRIAFHGTLIANFTKKDYETSILPQLRIFKLKRREGFVDRVCEMHFCQRQHYVFLFIQVQDERTIIGKALFKKETRIELFVSMKVELSTGIML